MREFYANWAYLVIAALAWNIKAWSGLLLPEKMGARTLLRMEFRRFLNEIVLVPAHILRTAGGWSTVSWKSIAGPTMLMTGTQRLKRWQYG